MTISRITLADKGSSFSRLALGFWRLTEWRLNQTELEQMVNTCLDMGLTTFDHAAIYGSYTCEEIFGTVLKANPAWRSKMELVTKCGIKMVSPNRPAHTITHYDTSKAHIIDSVEKSLTNLQTDYLDVLLIHRPDQIMDADEVAETFNQLKQAGKVLNFGVSNFLPFQFDLLASRLDFPLVTNQIEFSVAKLDALYDGTLDQCQRLRVSPMIWSPLGGGSLFRDNSEQATRLRQALSTVGAQLGGATIDQVALAWILAHPAKTVPVLGSGNMERIKQMVKADYLKLSREQWYTIWRASTGKNVP